MGMLRLFNPAQSDHMDRKKLFKADQEGKHRPAIPAQRKQTNLFLNSTLPFSSLALQNPFSDLLIIKTLLQTAYGRHLHTAYIGDANSTSTSHRIKEIKSFRLQSVNILEPFLGYQQILLLIVKIK